MCMTSDMTSDITNDLTSASPPEIVDPQVLRSAFEAAMEQAQLAYEADEVPVGCAALYRGQIIAAERNRIIEKRDPTAHAEILTIRRAAQILQNERLPEVSLFSTLEPCAMCAGAIIHARIASAHFLALDQKLPALRSVAALPGHNHNLPWRLHHIEGLDSSALLKRFFAIKRGAQKDAKRSDS